MSPGGGGGGLAGGWGRAGEYLPIQVCTGAACTNGHLKRRTSVSAPHRAAPGAGRGVQHIILNGQTSMPRTFRRGPLSLNVRSAPCLRVSRPGRRRPAQGGRADVRKEAVERELPFAQGRTFTQGFAVQTGTIFHPASVTASRLRTFGTPTQSIHHSALATSGGSPSRGQSEQYGSTPRGGGRLSRAAWMAQFSTTYRMAWTASRGDSSRCAW